MNNKIRWKIHLIFQEIDKIMKENNLIYQTMIMK